MSALPELGLGPAQLYAQADAAMYAAKRGGRTEIVLYEPSMEVAPSRAGATVSAVAEVIARGQLHPVYQPIVSIPDGHVIGVEGLIRPMPPSPFANPMQLFAAAEAGRPGSRSSTWPASRRSWPARVGCPRTSS